MFKNILKFVNKPGRHNGTALNTKLYILDGSIFNMEGSKYGVWGKKGAEIFWAMYRQDPFLQERIRKSRKKCTGTEWIKRASKMGIEVQMKKRKQLEKQIFDIVKNKKNYYLLARLCGFLVGDGSVSIRKDKNGVVHHDISFYPDSIEVATLFSATVEYLYLKKPTFERRINYFAERMSSKIACKHLLSITPFRSLTWKVPLKILLSDLERVEFLRAFFDCEAYVGKRNIQLQSINQKGLLQIRLLLNKMNVSSKIYSHQRKNTRWNTNYMIVISRKENIKKYAELIGFNHPVKRQKLGILADVPERLMGQSRELVPAKASRFES